MDDQYYRLMNLWLNLSNLTNISLFVVDMVVAGDLVAGLFMGETLRVLTIATDVKTPMITAMNDRLCFKVIDVILVKIFSY